MAYSPRPRDTITFWVYATTFNHTKAAQELENIPWWGKNILRGGKRAFGEQIYTKFNKINNNSENFGGARSLPGGPSPPGPP